MATVKRRAKFWRWYLVGLCLAVLLPTLQHRGQAQTGATLAPPPQGARATPLADFAHVQNYDLGTVSLIQTGVADPWQSMPLPLTGALALPQGQGPFPVVLLLHGRHPGCHFPAEGPSQWPCPAGTEIRFDQGLAYLAQALAEAGYLVMVPNLNGAYADAYGADAANRADLTDERSSQIIAAHLSRLAAAHGGESMGFPINLRGKADLSQLAIIGHSMGGGAAVGTARQLSHDAPVQPEVADFGPVGALLLVSPTPSRSAKRHPAMYELPDVPTSIIAGGCDRDVYDLSSFYYFETASLDPGRRSPTAAVMLLGANHNFFNRAVERDDYYRQPDNAPLCDPQQSDLRLSRVDQESFLVRYAVDFVDAALRQRSDGLSQGAAVLTAPIAQNELYGFPVLTNLAPGREEYRVIFRAGESVRAGEPESAPIPGGTTTVAICLAFEACDTVSPRYPDFPSVVRVTWDASGGQLTLPIAAEPGDGSVMQAFQSLQLRLSAPGADQASLPAGRFAVVLRDRAGRATRVEVPAPTPALRRLPPDLRYGNRRVLLYPSALRIPLAQFRGVDFSALTAVELVFDAGTSGGLYLAEVGLVGQWEN